LLPALPGATAHADTEAAGNDFYRVFVEDGPEGDGMGVFSIATGPAHPAGAGLTLLHGGGSGDAANSFVTVRSYTTGTDYVQTTSLPASSNLIVGLNEFASVDSIGATGYRTTFELPGPIDTPEGLRIVSDVNVNGGSFADSAIEITTTVSNLDVIPFRVGLRYLLDLDVAGDDGPIVIIDEPDVAPLATEATFATPEFSGIRAEDNDDDDEPKLSLVGTVSAEYPGIAPQTSAPDVLKHAFWSDAFATAFDYTTVDRDITSSPGLDDTVSISLFTTLPPTVQEDCGNGSDDDGDRLADDKDPDCAPPSPSPPPEPTATPTPSPAPVGLPPTGRDSATPARSATWIATLVGAGLLLLGAGMTARRR
jgi:hypothetical protein